MASSRCGQQRWLPFFVGVKNHALSVLEKKVDFPSWAIEMEKFCRSAAELLLFSSIEKREAEMRQRLGRPDRQDRSKHKATAIAVHGCGSAAYGIGASIKYYNKASISIKYGCDRAAVMAVSFCFPGASSSCSPGEACYIHHAAPL